MMKPSMMPVFQIATASSLVVLGDTLLYTILPSYYVHFGLAPYQVGLLLSVNRWIRLGTNYASAYAERLYPSQLWLLGSLFLGAVVTAIYGTIEAFIILLGARIVWGVCYSFIRQAGIMTALHVGDQAHAGKRMGYLRGTASLWQGIGVLLGGLSHDLFGFSTTLVTLSIIALAAVPLGSLSQRKIRCVDHPAPRFQLGEGNVGLPLCGFSIGVVGSGLIMSTLGLILKERFGDSLHVVGYTVGTVTLTGTILSGRWILDAVGLPSLGAAADSMERGRSIVFLFAIGGAAMLSAALLKDPLCLVLVVLACFVCGETLNMLLSTQAARLGPKNLASYVIALDLGSSLGPSFGWGLVQFGLPAYFIFFLAGVFYMLSTILSYRVIYKSLVQS